MHRTLPLVALLITLGCASSHDETPVRPGLYELAVANDGDGCGAAMPTGAMGEVAVFLRDGDVDAPVPDADGPLLAATRVRLDRVTLHAETNRRLCGDAFVHEEWTVLESGALGFEVLHTRDYEQMASCEAPTSAMPTTDCRAERRLRYDLRTACLAPCRLTLGVDAVRCTCE